LWPATKTVIAMQTQQNPINAPFETGVSLLEVMITVLILTVGLLGMAKLQMVSAAYNQSGFFRSQATLLAYDMADRMRAAGPARAPEYLTDFGADQPAQGDCQGVTEPGPLSPAADKQRWKGRLLCSLPEADGAIVQIGDVWRITVRWNDGRASRLDADDANRFQSMIYETRLF
jgi:type IV pilus assembly protein PilV